METETVVSLITSVGFPIIACVYMWKYINTTLKDFTEMMNKNNESIVALCEKIDTVIMQLATRTNTGVEEDE